MQARASELLSQLPEKLDGQPSMQAQGIGVVKEPVDRVEPVKIPPDSETRLLIASMLAQIEEIKQKLAATSALIEGALDPNGSRSDLIHEAARRDIPRWHFPMLNDIERNDAFAVALKRLVAPGAHVLDIGAGTGLLAMLAVRAGAGRVTACEANPLVAEIARQVVEAHGLSDVVTIIPRHSSELRIGRDLEAPVDLIVSETVDCGLIGEGLLSTMRHARRELLRPGGMLLPEAGRVFGALLESRVVARLNRVGTVAGFDMTLFNRVSTQGHFPLRLATWPHRLLSDFTELVAFDLRGDPLDDGAVTVTVTVGESGEAHGIVAWFELNLGAGVLLRNVSDKLGFHWMQAFLPFDEPLRVQAGQQFDITVGWQRERLIVRRIEPSSSTEVGQ